VPSTYGRRQLNVILLRAGIRTFETYTRNTLDIAAIPVIKNLSHLPIIADPSHARAGAIRCRQWPAAGWPGPMLAIEVHHDPNMRSPTGRMSLYPEPVRQLMAELRFIAPAVGRRMA